tara:strand:- start:467 stop:958 length:492 start_codon:yes stop_codon:yes gene_type:complete
MLDNLIGGYKAGHSAAKWVETVGFSNQEFLDEMALISEAAIETLSRSETGPSVGASVATLRRLMNSNVGLERDAAMLSSCSLKIEEMLHATVRISDESFVMNTELINAVKLQGMLTLAKTIVSTAEAREESRGSHRRIDYPESAEKYSQSLVVDSAGIVTTLN